MAIPLANEQKKQLRKQMRALLADGGPVSGGVLDGVRTWLAGQPHLKTVSTYSPLPGEIDLTPLVAEFPKIHWVFPRVEGPELVMHSVSDPARDLEPGAFGIREPLTSLPRVPFFEIDAFLCPGLAFDEYGGRLGRGRGFYDRMLGQARSDALKIGVCRKQQIVADIFSEPHDIVMDQVIS